MLQNSSTVNVMTTSNTNRCCPLKRGLKHVLWHFLLLYIFRVLLVFIKCDKCVHLWHQLLFICPPAGRHVSIFHLTSIMCTSHIWAGIAHICLIFAPNSEFHWATSTFGLCCELWTSVSWSWLWHQLTLLNFDAWRRFLHHLTLLTPPHPLHMYLWLSWSHEKHSSVI